MPWLKMRTSIFITAFVIPRQSAVLRTLVSASHRKHSTSKPTSLGITRSHTSIVLGSNQFISHFSRPMSSHPCIDSVPSCIVCADWLRDRLACQDTRENTRVVDATWFLPNSSFSQPDGVRSHACSTCCKCNFDDVRKCFSRTLRVALSRYPGMAASIRSIFLERSSGTVM